MEASAEPGRREQNKRRTHDALIQAASRLFQEKGYGATTVRDIAAAAGVGERTFFRYFPSKDSLIHQRMLELIPVLTDEIRARPTQEPPLMALRNALQDLGRQDEMALAVFLAGRQQLASVPTGRGDRHLLFEAEKAFADAFLDRTAAQGADPATLESQLRTTVLARAAVGVLRAVQLVYTRLPETVRSGIDLSEFTDKAFAMLSEPGTATGD